MSNNKNRNYNSQPQSTGNQITASILILSIILSFTLGLIGGYFFGESRTEKRLGNIVTSSGINSGNNGQNSGNQGTSQEDEFNKLINSIDYTKFVINKDKNLTVDNYYSDAETKYYASNLIGMTVPEMKWKMADGTEKSNKDLGDKYIIEIFSPNCTYCQQSIPEVDKWREAHPETPLISLTTESGDISKFNEKGEYAFTWVPDSAANTLLNNVPWIPAFIMVENGKITLVDFGAVTQETIDNYVDTAFSK